MVQPEPQPGFLAPHDLSNYNLIHQAVPCETCSELMQASWKERTEAFKHQEEVEELIDKRVAELNRAQTRVQDILDGECGSCETAKKLRKAIAVEKTAIALLHRVQDRLKEARKRFTEAVQRDEEIMKRHSSCASNYVISQFFPEMLRDCDLL